MKAVVVLLAGLLLVDTGCLVAGIPAFIGPRSRTAYVNENSPQGTPVLTVYAADEDGGTFSFNLTPTGQFVIDSGTGTVTVATSPTPPLDREATESISVSVNLLNSGGTVVETLPVTIFLNDLNDNSPRWINQISSLSSPLPEDTAIGTLIYSIVATDADIGSNGDIRFRLDSPGDGTFAVNSVSGVVTLARALDADTADSLVIVIRAEDQGSPSRSTSITFTVSITPVVSSAPVFTQTHYFVSLNEGDYTSENVNNLITVVAVVADDPTANVVYTQVMRGVPSDSLFSVSETGVVNVIGVLDRETENTYDVQIQAHVAASGLPNSTTDTTLVTVTVLDINDNSPVFENPHPENIILMETTPASTVVYTFYATDADEGTNAVITYELTSPIPGPFSIGSTSGVVHLSSTLDHDANSIYTITVQAQDGGSPPRNTTTSLEVVVSDVVSAPPSFTETVYTFEVEEGTHTNVEVGRVQAVDSENPGSATIRYEQVTRGDITDTLFSVSQSGNTAGRIAITGTVDREIRDVYAISIRAFRVATASDSTPQSEASIVSVIIEILDANDNSPVWTSVFSAISIPESQPVGTDIFSATATDADSGANGRVTYSFVSPPANLPFSIDETSGVVRLTRVLDFDTQSSYTLTIRAQDGGNPSRSITNSLTVSIQDALDMAPTFTESVYSLEVTEGTYTNEMIGSVRAQETGRPNAVIRYEKVSGDSRFSVTSSGSNAGVITLTGTVDAEATMTHTVTIRAFRVTTGTTPRSDISTVTVIVTILDSNDNSPVWTDPTPGPISLIETRPIGTDVFVVAATDADSGTNGEVSYSLPPPVDGPFSIGSSSGVIRLTNRLDFIVQPQYNLIITAQDGADPPRSVNATLTINVVNVLDPPPTFTESIYTESIEEGSYTNRLLGTVLAVDPLNPSGAVIRYEEVQPGHSFFTVVASGNSAGQVILTGSLDRETTSAYSISIRAFRVADASSTSPLSETSIVSMLITVTDVNDNAPMFLNPSSGPISLLETRPVGSIIYSFHAVDPDSGSNGEVTFSLVSPVESPFTVHSGSGVVRIRNVLDYDVRSSYTLTIRAQDNGSPQMVTDTTLTVNLVDVLDPPPVFGFREYSVEVAEGTYTNHLLETVQAVDTLHPTTAEIRYEQIPKGDITDDLFRVVATGMMAGQVFLTGTVDLSVDTYFINIRAFRVVGSDTTPRSGISTVSMTIAITDINDNPPVILNPRTTPISIIETRPVGTVIYSYHATDSDLGSNGRITYTIQPNDAPFGIDENTGVVRLTSALDFTVQDSYMLTITAQDSGNTVLSASTVLNIVVVDVTDPPPVFSLSSYAFSVMEGLDDVVVGRVTATDVINPTGAILRYEQVMKGDVTDMMFSTVETGSSAGEIQITMPADREVVDSYVISIRAFRVANFSEVDPISGISVVSVVISIDDVNDNSPVILNPPGDSLSIFETRLAGSILYTVYATDADDGDNADISYNLTSSPTGPFSIGMETGIIRLTDELDFDASPSYRLVISAQDNGSPPRTDTATLAVNVVDILDPPPTFSQSIYNVQLNEGTYSSRVLLSVQAVDALHPDAIIRYEQIMKNDETDSLFSVESNGANAGQVTLTGIIDREADTIHTMNIRAFRVASSTSITPRSAVSIVSVVLTVLDSNDNTPVWLNPIVDPISIVETAPVGTVVYSLIVSDSDEGTNGRITYSLSSPMDGTFVVNQGGVVMVSGMLDVSVTSSYTIIVTATDQGILSMSANFQLNVVVTEALAPSPTFSSLVYSVSASEGDYTATALHVTDVSATPGTVGSVIRYSIQSRVDGSHIPFTVNNSITNVGTVEFNGVLDRENQPTWIVVVEALEIDAVTALPRGSSLSFATIVLTVTDVNDNSPTFVTDHYFGSVSELARVGDVAAAGVRAFDIDEGSNSIFAYSFPSGGPSLPFTIDSVTGVISVSEALDYETTPNYQFSIEAQETSTTDQFFSTAVVTINVINENENFPIFAETTYQFLVPENQSPRPLTSSVPAGLTAITATDADAGIFGDLTYTLLGFGVPGRFEVSGTGVISTTSTLDYEERSVYHLTLIAQDGGGTLNNSNQATTQITVEVLDVNDHTPTCFPPSTVVTLEENRMYSNFLTISAVDGDPPNTNNSRLTYSINFANGTSSASLFTINPSNGQISASPLNYEAEPTHMYGLTVTVSDAGAPSTLTTTCSVTVNIRDFNDNAPIFSQSVYTGRITENHPVGTTVGVTVMATDPETEHTLAYFPVTSDPHSAFFSVGRTDGIIRLAQEVDYDPPANHREFSFGVLAIDDATPPLTGTATVRISIDPENDNTPIISNPPNRDPFNYTLIEDMGTPVPFPLLSVDASDLDQDTLNYTFVTTNSFLSLDSSNGDITLVSTLDREAQASHAVIVQVCDPGMRCSIVTLYIMVTDYNDNPPFFIPSSLAPTVTASECMASGGMILDTLIAVDVIDLGQHAAVTYQAVGGDITRFSVGMGSGIVTISPNTVWDFETEPNSYSLIVRGIDFPGGSPQLRTPMDANLTFVLTDCNDLPTIFHSSSYTFIINETISGASSVMEVFTGLVVTDGDTSSENRVAVFSIIGAPASTNGWFGVDSNTGHITILQGAVVDREHSSIAVDSMGRGVLSFNVQVLNPAPTGTFNSTATVTVLISDINDHPPVIQQVDPVRVTVLEHSALGTLITVISAVDIFDFGANTHVVYEIISGNEDGNFVINSNTGVVTVAGDLDHENVTQYTIVVQAREDMGDRSTTPDTIQVIIDIIGANDFSPMFDLPRYTVALQEYNSFTRTSLITPGDTIATVHATDRDGPATAAGTLEYRIANGATLLGVEMFSIPNPSEGVVTILRPDLLDYEGQRQFVLTIEAHDLVTPLNERRHNTTQLVVNVVDVNDVVPSFVDPSYTGSVAENQPIGTIVIVTPTIRGQDADNNNMDILTFSILPGQPFSITSDGRTVRTTAVLDREALISQSYRLTPTLQVTDQAGHTSDTTLTVTVTDVNDNPPCFAASTVTSYSVEENRAVFPNPLSFVGRVVAMDADLPNNPQITYFISEGDGGDFNIDPQTGDIFVISQLNREEITNYTLSITSTDGNLTCGLQVFIFVLETNDNDPIFSRNPYLGSLVENAAVGSTVDVNFTTTGVSLQVTATDIDENPIITYSILPQEGLDVPFSVHPDTGIITTNNTLDREMVSEYSFRVEAHDGLRNSSSLVEVVVLDFNDESPVFISNFSNITVPELTPASFVFLFLEANDGDEGTNAEIRYSVTNVEPLSELNMFNITERTGGIFATQDIVIDDGDPLTIILTITASNLRSSLPQNVPIPTDTATVIVNLEPQNAFAPNFTSPHYTFSVTENQNGSIIGSVFATEQAGDVGTIIMYSIVGSGGSDFINFRVDPLNGSVVNVNSFDRESVDLYQFSITAMDNAPLPRFGYTTVNVRVLDENDNAPVFRFDPYTVTVLESSLVNTTFLTVFATDMDVGINAELTYSIAEGDTSVFSINGTTGEIQTLVQLDREDIDLYSFVVSAEDGGSPPTSTDVQVVVTVGDVNDNDPYFTEGVNITVEIYENATAPYNIIAVQARDDDANGNAQLVYTFENGGAVDGPFEVERTSGRVFLRNGNAGRLDRETQDFYEVTVIASDQAGRGPDIRSTFASFFVRVLDINDNVPVFESPLFEFEVSEDYPLDMVFGNVRGMDADIMSNAIIFYHLLGGNMTNTTCVDQFCINHETGGLYLREMLDLESQEVHTLSLATSNLRELQFNSTSQGELIDATTGVARVEVLDVNDSPPVFIPSSLFAAVEEDVPFDVSVAQLEATDLDTGNGSVVWYSIVSQDSPFVVDRDTGVITTAGVFRGQSGMTLQVQVRAFDNFGIPPTQSTTATLSALVYKCGEQIELSFEMQREVIEAGIDRIRNALSELTDARVYITAITVRQTIAGEVDVTGTDIKFIALDAEASRVLDPNAILRVIDENHGSVQSALDEFGLQNIFIEPCGVASTAITASDLPPWLWVLIALLILGLCCLCCCCLLICIGERRKTRRWKSKAVKSNYQSQLDQFSQHQMTVFGQENPLWVDPYPYDQESTTDISGRSATDRENPLYESQELTVEMFQAPSSDEEEVAEERPDTGEKMYESQEILLEMFSDNLSEASSHARLIKAPAKDLSSPLTQDVDDLLERALDDTDEYEESTTSFI